MSKSRDLSIFFQKRIKKYMIFLMEFLQRFHLPVIFLLVFIHLWVPKGKILWQPTSLLQINIAQVIKRWRNRHLHYIFCSLAAAPIWHSLLKCGQAIFINYSWQIQGWIMLLKNTNSLKSTERAPGGLQVGYQ